MKLSSHLKSFKNRIIMAIFLLTVLSGLCFYYNINFEANNKYFSDKFISVDYPEGKTIYVSGDFAGTYDGGFYIKNRYQNQITIYKISSSYNATYGDMISVLGTLGPSFTVYPQKIVINKQWKEDFLLYRSALCGVILLLIFRRYWKFDLKNMEFMRLKETHDFLNLKNIKFLRKK